MEYGRVNKEEIVGDFSYRRDYRLLLIDEMKDLFIDTYSNGHKITAWGTFTCLFESCLAHSDPEERDLIRFMMQDSFAFVGEEKYEDEQDFLSSSNEIDELEIL